MWRDDLDRMVAVLHKISHQKVDMKVDDYEIDDVADIADLASQGVHAVRSFSFTGGNSGEVTLQLGKDISLLQITGDDLASKGAAQEVYEIALGCRRLVTPDFVDTLFGAALLVAPVVGRAIYDGLSRRRDVERPKPRVLLDTRTRKEAPTFWDAKKRDVDYGCEQHYFTRDRRPYRLLHQHLDCWQKLRGRRLGPLCGRSR